MSGADVGEAEMAAFVMATAEPGAASQADPTMEPTAVGAAVIADDTIPGIEAAGATAQQADTMAEIKPWSPFAARMAAFTISPAFSGEALT